MLIACCFRPTIRELRLEDIPPAAGLLSDAFAPPDGYNPLQRRIIVAETEAGLAARLGKSLVLVAEQDDGEIVGSVEAFTPAFLEGKAVRFWNASLPLDTYLSALAVAPGSRRSGLAFALVESVEERAWSAGEGAVSLQVDELNTAAVALYRKLGYSVVGRDRAVTTPSRNALVSNLLLGGVKERSLLALQKACPAPEPAAEEEEATAPAPGRLARWLRRGRTALARVSPIRMAAPPPPPPQPREVLQPPALLPLALKRRWRNAFGCATCEGSRAVACPNCDGAGGYKAMGGVAVACKACRSTGRVVCRDCFVGDGWDIEAIRRDMGVPD